MSVRAKDNKSKMKTLFYLLFFVLIIHLSSCETTNSSETVSIRGCLVNYDWCQPNCSSPIMAWKFAIDGTFSYSTSMFGGMSTWGTWRDIGGDQIELIYTKTTKGDLLPKKTLTMPDCKSLKIGSTLYKR